MFAADAVKLSSGWFLENAWLIGVVPVVAFALILFFGKRMPNKGSEIGLASMAISTVLATAAGWQWIQRVDSADDAAKAVEGVEGEATGLLATFSRSVPRAGEGEAEPFVEPVVNVWTWWSSGGVEFGFGSLADGLSVLLLWLVAFISLLVQVFSLDYLRGDRRYTHFFAAITLFSGGMLIMVMAENMVQLILGWEIMGLCSFLLIGHWWEDYPNARAALKAFFTVRVGDVGLLVGTAIIFWEAREYAESLGTHGFNIPAIQAWALSGEANSTALTWAAVALFIAAIGKSGQFPLHTWLPDAMAGPTPVSSLLHSSTMVVAGVFLVARIFPVFWEGFSIGTGAVGFIGVIGAITIVIAALLAFVQDDIKKVLAYSTVSQLGYMMLGLGTGAWLPAVFHIFTHAFFKCCLFLCAGSISHSASHHSFDMKKDMGGLRKVMPWTFAAWCVSTLALTGVIPFSGFWSKDEIIDNVGNNGYTFFMWVGLVGAALTAMYMTRATYLTFFGEPRGAAAGEHHDDHDDAHAHAEEAVLVGAGAPADHDDSGSPRSLSAAVVDDDNLGGGHAADDAADHGGHGDDDHGDHHDDHHGPRESGALLLVPVVILAFFAIFSGFANATPLAELTGNKDWEQIKKYVEPRPEAVPVEQVVAAGPGEGLVAYVPGFVDDGAASFAAGQLAADEEGAKEGCGFGVPEEGTVCFFPAVSHAVPTLGKIALSLAVVAIGYALAITFCLRFYRDRDKRLVGLTERNSFARGGYKFLVNKYYLDDLYEKVIVHAIAHPISKAAYWVNQQVIDGTVDTVGESGRRTGEWVYDNIDQKIVDGAVNASGTVASETGHGLQPVQSGKVNQYGALIFGAAAVAAIVLVIVNT